MNFIGVHWISTHKADWDRNRFAQYDPEWFKIVVIDENIAPFLDYAPPNAKIIIRNHPMSELFDARGSMRAASVSPDDYWLAWEVEQDRRRADNGRRRGFMTPVGRSVSAVYQAEMIAEEHSEICYRTAMNAKAAGCPIDRLWFEGLNEPQIWGPEPEQVVARYYRRFATSNHSWGGHSIVWNGGVGWPGNHGVAGAKQDWRFMELVVAAMGPADMIGSHQYWGLKGPLENWGWWTGAWMSCPFDAPFILTETGIDTGVYGQWYGGWRDLPGQTHDDKAARYVNELRFVATEAVKDQRLRGMLPFTYDIGSPHWEKFDIRDDTWHNAYVESLKTQGPIVAQPWGGQPNVPEYLPDIETSTDPAILAEKVRWWTEEATRALEADNAERAMSILHSIIKLDNGLLYKLENILKG